MDALYGIAADHGLEVLEDAGSALGARFGEHRLGNGPCACVFQLDLATGSAPKALLTLPSDLFSRVGQAGGALRMGGGAARIVRQRLDALEDTLSARRANASHYSSELVRYDAFGVPPTPDDALPAYASYCLRITRYARTNADDLGKLLLDAGIETRRIAVPLTERELVRLPATESARGRGILLPVDAHLSETHRQRILDAIFDYAVG